jgi:hypothetical protein
LASTCVDADHLGCGLPQQAARRIGRLCEVNASSVSAIPDQASAAIARLVQERMMARQS